MPIPLATPKRAALFDMDRTLVRVNTGALYIRWRYTRRQAGLRDVARVARWMAQYSLGMVNAEQVTTRVLSQLQGLEEASFRDELRGWYADRVRPHITAAARREVERCRKDGYVLGILSASTYYAIAPLAEELGIEHILCSQLEVRDGRFTGRCESLCYGDGKVDSAEQWAEEMGVRLDNSLFYTDSVSDLPMLRRVGAPRIINPDPRLRWLARREGWPIEHWR